jgi:hypothetical protein
MYRKRKNPKILPLLLTLNIFSFLYPEGLCKMATFNIFSSAIDHWQLINFQGLFQSDQQI